MTSNIGHANPGWTLLRCLFSEATFLVYVWARLTTSHEWTASQRWTHRAIAAEWCSSDVQWAFFWNSLRRKIWHVRFKKKNSCIQFIWNDFERALFDLFSKLNRRVFNSILKNFKYSHVLIKYTWVLCGYSAAVFFTCRKILEQFKCVLGWCIKHSRFTCMYWSLGWAKVMNW